MVVTDHYIRIHTSVGNMSVIYIYLPGTKYHIKVIIGVNSLLFRLSILKDSSVLLVSLTYYLLISMLFF